MNIKTVGRMMIWIYFVAVIGLGAWYWSRPVRVEQVEVAGRVWKGIWEGGWE